MTGCGARKKFRQRPTLPHGPPCSTIGAVGLNFRVRDGIGCDPHAIATGNWEYEHETGRGRQSGLKPGSAAPSPSLDELRMVKPHG